MRKSCCHCYRLDKIIETTSVASWLLNMQPVISLTLNKEDKDITARLNIKNALITLLDYIRLTAEEQIKITRFLEEELKLRDRKLWEFSTKVKNYKRMYRELLGRLAENLEIPGWLFNANEAGAQGEA